LQHARDRIVVLGRGEHDAVGGQHLLLRGLDRGGKALRLDVGVVKRPAADLDGLDRCALRKTLDERLQRHAVERAFAQASAERDEFDVWLGHCLCSRSGLTATYQTMALRDITLY